MTDDTAKRVFADRVSMDMNSTLIRQRTQFKAEYPKPTLRLRKRFLEGVPSAPTGVAAIELMEEYLDCLEAAMQPILEAHSSYYWLYMLRRIFPASADGHDAWSIALSRRIAELAILKYGRPSAESQDWTITDDQVIPKEYGFWDYVAIYQVEYLAFEYWHVTACLRSVWKGATLLSDGGKFGCWMDEELHALTSRVDQRVAATPLLAQIAGIDELYFPTDGEPLNSIVVPVLNVHALEVDLAVLGGPSRPNYLPVPVDLEVIRFQFEPFAESMRENLGFSPEEMVTFLQALWLRFSYYWFRMGEDEENRYRFFTFVQRGYWVYFDSAGSLADEIAAAYHQADDSTNLPDLASIMQRCIEYFTITPDLVESISLWDRSPYRLIWNVGEWLLVDYARVNEALAQIASDLGSLAGANGFIKGMRLEENVVNALEQAGQVEPWESQKVLKFPDGRKREIDASFRSGEVLVIVECKALVRSYLLDRGEIVTIERRWEELRTYVEIAEDKASLIAASPDGLNYATPDAVSTVVTIVCTANAEYTMSQDAAFWLDESTPRVCTTSELIRLIDEGYDWSACPGAVKVSRSG